ncbi:MAG: hypothetical protein ACJ796_17810 [Gemmatimonadaceae bacterium]
MIRGRVDAGCADYSNDREAKSPDSEAHDGAMAALPCGDAGFMQAVEAERHPWPALVGAIDSLMASRHSTLGTT